MLRALMTVAIISIMTINLPMTVEAANVDDELSIMAAEQRKDNDADVTVDDDIETFEEEKPARQSEPQPEQPIQEQQPQPQPQQSESPQQPSQPQQQINSQPVTLPSDNLKINDENVYELTDIQDDQRTSSQIIDYANFAEAAKKVGFIPLYVPRKSGYALDNISVLNNNIIELRYGRRWEPTVTLAIRTYKRASGEELKDISGISGVKWKVDLSSGMTLYIARISDNSSVAAWSVGQYTFAAMTENLSFAAFHAFIVEELVDLCNHYFIDIN